MHPEGGHVVVSPLNTDLHTDYSWVTPNLPHSGIRTVESIASNVGILSRLGMKSSSLEERDSLASLPDDHDVWDHVANAIGNLCATLVLVLSSEKIVLGGGVMKRRCLMGKVRRRTMEILNGYVDRDSVRTMEGMESYIVRSRYGDDAGVIGGLIMASEALKEDEKGGLGGGGKGKKIAFVAAVFAAAIAGYVVGKRKRY